MQGRKTILAQNSKGVRPWSLGSVLEQNTIEVDLCIKNVLYLKVDKKKWEKKSLGTVCNLQSHALYLFQPDPTVASACKNNATY